MSNKANSSLPKLCDFAKLEESNFLSLFLFDVLSFIIASPFYLVSVLKYSILYASPSLIEISTS